MNRVFEVATLIVFLAIIAVALKAPNTVGVFNAAASGFTNSLAVAAQGGYGTTGPRR